MGVGGPREKTQHLPGSMARLLGSIEELSSYNRGLKVECGEWQEVGLVRSLGPDSEGFSSHNKNFRLYPNTAGGSSTLRLSLSKIALLLRGKWVRQGQGWRRVSYILKQA